MQLNVVAVIGRLVNDASFSQVQTAKGPMGMVTLPVSLRSKRGGEAGIVNFTAFGKTADKIRESQAKGQYLKNSMVSIQGYVRPNIYQKDGANVYSLNMTAMYTSSSFTPHVQGAKEMYLNNFSCIGKLVGDVKISSVMTQNGQVKKADMALGLPNYGGILYTTAWGEQAEYIEKSIAESGRFRKGCNVVLSEAEVRQNTYEKNGKKTSTLQIVTYRCVSDEASVQQAAQPYQQAVQPYQQAAQPYQGAVQTQAVPQMAGMQPGTVMYGGQQQYTAPVPQPPVQTPVVSVWTGPETAGTPVQQRFGGFTPAQPAGGYMQAQPVGGFTPAQPVGGFTPAQPVASR